MSTASHFQDEPFVLHVAIMKDILTNRHTSDEHKSDAERERERVMLREREGLLR